MKIYQFYQKTFHGLLSGQIKPAPESISRKQLAQMVLEAEEEKEQKGETDQSIILLNI